MNIDTVGENKIKISLTDDEINSLFGGYDMIDYEHPRSKMVLNTLLSSALPEEKIPLDCKKVLIEVHPICGGCAIFFTSLYEKDTAVKCRKPKGYFLVFKNSENMIKLINELGQKYKSDIKNSRLIITDGCFVLYIKVQGKLLGDLGHIKEYCKVYKEKSPYGSYITEHGETVCKNAVFKMFNAFFKNQDSSSLISLKI